MTVSCDVCGTSMDKYLEAGSSSFSPEGRENAHFLPKRMKGPVFLEEVLPWSHGDFWKVSGTSDRHFSLGLGFSVSDENFLREK